MHITCIAKYVLKTHVVMFMTTRRDASTLYTPPMIRIFSGSDVTSRGSKPTPNVAERIKAGKGMSSILKSKIRGEKDRVFCDIPGRVMICLPT